MVERDCRMCAHTWTRISLWVHWYRKWSTPPLGWQIISLCHEVRPSMQFTSSEAALSYTASPLHLFVARIKNTDMHKPATSASMHPTHFMIVDTMYFSKDSKNINQCQIIWVTYFLLWFGSDTLELDLSILNWVVFILIVITIIFHINSIIVLYDST